MSRRLLSPSVAFVAACLTNVHAEETDPFQALVESFELTTTGAGTFLQWTTPEHHEVTLQKSSDLKIWNNVQTFPGFGQPVTFQVHAPPPSPGNPSPDLPAPPFHFFSISPYNDPGNDGHTHIMWRDASGQTFEVYDDLDFHAQNFPPLWQVDVIDGSQSVTHRVYTHLLNLPFLPHYPSLTPASLPPEA